MKNPRIDEATLISNLTSRCAQQVRGRRVLAIQDTTHVVMQHHAGLFSDDDPDLGHVGTGEEVGFLLHPVLVMDLEDRMALGFSDVKLWTRQGSKWGEGTKKEKDKRAAKAKIEQKESFFWVESGQKSREVLAEAEQVIVVGDRGSDIYEFFCRVPNEKTDILLVSEPHLQNAPSHLNRGIQREPSFFIAPDRAKLWHEPMPVPPPRRGLRRPVAVPCWLCSATD